MVRRIHPRHTVDRVTVRPYSETDAWVGSYGDPVTLPAQVQYSREVVTDDHGTRAVTLLTARVPASAGSHGPTPGDYPPGSEIAHEGHTAWVHTARPVTRHGMLVYLELTAGEQLPRAEGGVTVVDAVLHRSSGWDSDGVRIPSTDVGVPASVLVPRSTSEPEGDSSQATDTTADWFVPAELAVSSTSSVTIPGPASLAGRWQVDGDPAPDGDRLRVPLRRA